MESKKPIFLIGYMGCGKSTLGKQLAKLMNREFIDLDKYIEEKFFCSIPDIFANEGEEAFRRKEKNSLIELMMFDNVVVATGGGAPCFHNNIEKMNESGTTIYISPTEEVLAERLLLSKTNRPLIAGKDKEELVVFIRETLSKRNQFYTKAKYSINATDESTAQDILDIIES